MAVIDRVTPVRRNNTYPVTVQLNVWSCATCGIVYGVPKSFADDLRTNGGHYFCPNGDRLEWFETAADKERKRAEAAEARADQAERTARYQREGRERAERSAIAYKGHLTRIKNRIANGVCPVPGCRRSGFTKVMAHIASKHPDWAAEHAHEIA